MRCKYFVLALALFSLSFAFAQEEPLDLDEALGGAGVTPDSFLGGIDDTLDRWFGDPAEVRKEKIAEMRVMIQEGNVVAAKEALERYNEFAREFEKEVSPAERAAAEESALVIRRAIEEIEGDIPEDERASFQEVIQQEARIEKAAEIADKIKGLCEELADLDPGEFYRVCSAGEDGPEWQQDLFNDLSAEQEREAKQFFKVMGQCFEGPENCNCDEIPHVAFANLCREVKPLAIACEEGDEEACERMDSKTEDVSDLLEDAPHLQRVFADLQRFESDQFEHHVPEECQEAGATTQLECEEVFFRADAPRECVAALDAGEFSFEGEREAHEFCEQVLFDVHAPEECKEKGIDSHEACGKLLWELYTPQECKDAGLTGERQSDQRKCDEIMENLHFEADSAGAPFDAGAGCRDIEDPDARLACFDAALSVDFHSPREREQAFFDEDFEPEEFEEFDEAQVGDESFEPETEPSEGEVEGERVEEETSAERDEAASAQDEEDDSSEQHSERSLLTGNVVGIDNAFFRYYYR